METVVEPTSLEEAYRAAHEDAIIVDRSNLGILKLTGETRLDLIHRMSTQDIKDLSSGQGNATVLTTDIGRMVDRLLLYASSDAIYAVTGENNAENVARYLMRFVFFQDDFHVEDLSEETRILGVYGERAGDRLRALFGEAVDLPLHHWRQVPVSSARSGDEQATLYIHRTDPVAGDGYFLMFDVDDEEAVQAMLNDTDLTASGESAFDYLRIESGLPRYGQEITEEYIPLEAGLWDDVSFSKGCYTGQEIIARMESRGRLAKQLVHLQAEQTVERGADIEAGGKAVGSITSSGDGPAGPLALGYVKTRALQKTPETTLKAGEVSLKVKAAVGR